MWKHDRSSSILGLLLRILFRSAAEQAIAQDPQDVKGRDLDQCVHLALEPSGDRDASDGLHAKRSGFGGRFLEHAGRDAKGDRDPNHRKDHVEYVQRHIRARPRNERLEHIARDKAGTCPRNVVRMEVDEKNESPSEIESHELVVVDDVWLRSTVEIPLEHDREEHE